MFFLILAACGTQQPDPDANAEPTSEAEWALVDDDFQSRGDSDAVRDVIRRNQRHIRSCYERRLHDHPGLDGRVALDITVAAGKVTAATVAENTTRDEPLASCIVQRVRRWEFPADVSDEIHLPLSLSR